MKSWKPKLLWIALAGILILTGILLLRGVQPKPAILDEQTQYIRSLAASNDPALAEILDGSMELVPAGEFIRGSDTGYPNERPQQLVYLDAFTVDRYEVTNIQYSRFLESTGRKAPSYWVGGVFPEGQADYPVIGIRWGDANAYCEWADKRLPTEAEWEKACRGTDGRQYPWGNDWDSERANVGMNQDAFSMGQPGSPTAMAYAWELLLSTPSANGLGLRPVGSYPDGASPYGVLDMTGNASEWVVDWYNWTDYSALPTRNPVNLEPPWNHCLRGSPWFDPVGTLEEIPARSRCSARSSAHSISEPRTGFRCARSFEK